MRPEDLLQRSNPWWLGSGVASDLLRPFKRSLFDELTRFVDDRQVLVLRGLRCTGKTTLLFQLIDSLLAQRVPPRAIVYYSFDELAWDLGELIGYIEENVLQQPLRPPGRVFLLLDEVQYLEQWPLQVKQFYDLYPRLKFVVSGSASLGLSRHRADGEREPGRTLLLFRPTSSIVS